VRNVLPVWLVSNAEVNLPDARCPQELPETTNCAPEGLLPEIRTLEPSFACSQLTTAACESTSKIMVQLMVQQLFPSPLNTLQGATRVA
jgi:hypothetical protein